MFSFLLWILRGRLVDQVVASLNTPISTGEFWWLSILTEKFGQSFQLSHSGGGWRFVLFPWWLMMLSISFKVGLVWNKACSFTKSDGLPWKGEFQRTWGSRATWGKEFVRTPLKDSEEGQREMDPFWIGCYFWGKIRRVEEWRFTRKFYCHGILRNKWEQQSLSGASLVWKPWPLQNGGVCAILQLLCELGRQCSLWLALSVSVLLMGLVLGVLLLFSVWVNFYSLNSRQALILSTFVMYFLTFCISFVTCLFESFLELLKKLSYMSFKIIVDL